MIDWTKLKPYDNDKRKSFEELCYQVAKKLYSDLGEFTSIDDSGGGDGVEFYLTLPNSDVWGWQAKFYFPDRRLSASRKRSITDSLTTTLANHSTLRRWYICTPTNFSAKGKDNEQTWFDDTLKQMADDVEFYHWGDSDFNEMLAKPEMAGKLHYFFGELELKPQWFNDQVKKQIANVRHKFMSDLHVETPPDFRAHSLIGDQRFLDRLSYELDRGQGMRDRIMERCSELQRFAIEQKWDNEVDAVLSLVTRLVELIDEEIARISICYRLVVEGCIEEAQQLDVDPERKALWQLAGELRDISQTIYEHKAKDAPQETTPQHWDTQSYLDTLRSTLFGPLHACSEFEPFYNAARVIMDLKRGDLHFLGSAGIGKTHLVCHMCKDRVDAYHPAILLHGGQFGSSTKIEAQIRDIIDLPASYAWVDFLSALDSCAEAHRTRALIAIDALNEATDIQLWQRELKGFTEQLARYPRIALVTTCRESYQNPIWGNDLDLGADYLYGFGGSNTIEAITRYFEHYKIRADLTLAPLEQFRHPLYLRIFCETENPLCQSEKEVYLGQQTLFKVFDKFIGRKNDIVCERLGKLPGVHILHNALPKLASLLWEHNHRHIALEDAAHLLDGVHLQDLNRDKSLTWVLLDEGLIINRDWIDSSETVLFTYDLLAGYLIAKHVLADVGAEKVADMVQSDEFTKKLLGEDRRELHPLHEDILRSMCALLPERTGRHLYELIEQSRAFDYSITALFEMEPTYIGDEQVARLHQLFANPDNREILLSFAKYTALNIGHPLNAQFWDRLLTDLTMPERDISWSEHVRSETDDLMAQLNEFMRTCQRAILSPITESRLELAARYYSWLLTSTDRSLRDRATRALHVYGTRFPAKLFELTTNSLGLNDPYVPERLLAASYGVAMMLHASPDASDFTKHILPGYAKTIFALMFASKAPHATTHVLMRDYARRSVELALIHHPALLSETDVVRLRPPYKEGGIRVWGKSKDRNKNDYRDGNAPIHMDFHNYTLGGLVPGRSNYDDSSPDYRKVVANIYWRIYDLGYSLETFGDIDKMIARRSPLSRSSDNADRVDRYGKKYSWIAFYELYGLRQDNGLMESEWTDEEPRPSEADIDPSFPELPHELRLIDTDFLGDRTITLCEWVTAGGNPPIEPYMIMAGLLDESGSWVMLHGHHSQEDEVTDRGRFTFVRGFMVPERQAVELVRTLLRHPVENRRLPEIPDDYYVFAGEIPWSEDYPENGFTSIAFRSSSGAGYLEHDGTIVSADSDGSTEVKAPFDVELIIQKLLSKTEESVSVSCEPTLLASDEELSSSYEVFIPVRTSNWESYHSGENPSPNACIPAKEIARHFGLSICLPSWDMCDTDGCKASASIGWGSGDSRQRFCYLRRDLLDRFVEERSMVLVWVVWGEREVRFDSDKPYPPSGVDFEPRVVFQEVLVYRSGNILSAEQFVNES